MDKRLSDGAPQSLNGLDERACAYRRTVVFMRSAYPNAAVMTYDSVNHRGAEHLILCKLVCGDADGWFTFDSCGEETRCENVKGGLCSVARTPRGDVKLGLYPLMLDDALDDWTGGAVLTFEAEEPGLRVKLGAGGISFMHFSPNKAMSGTNAGVPESTVYISDGCAVIKADGRPVTAVRGDFSFTRGEEDGSPYAVGFCPGRRGCLVIGFADIEEKANEISKLDGESEYRKIQAFYKEKFKDLYVKTPDEDINSAFEHAYLNLEYAYFYPYGWIESFHHWPTMWHMEQTAAEEWAGNPTRARDCLLSQLDRLIDGDKVPDLCTNGAARRDWGGNNQFFFREAYHYLQLTDDREFARRIYPSLPLILRQTFAEYDAAGTGVLGWHSQIGNQEDFEATPGRGAAPGSEGARMLYLMSLFCDYMGDGDRAEEYRDYSAYCVNALKTRLWQKDLGRFCWFADDYGEKRLDTTYHGICYPIIYGQIDSEDAQSSADHLLHRLTGAEGELYQSNHFGDHAYWGVPTWGMQCGSDMQPFATAAYALLGKNNEAVLPLKYVAKRVCGEYQRGSFPETANELRYAYFSPSAGVYAQAVIESIFGLKRDKTRGVTEFSPCFPDGWKHAEMKLPSAEISYSANGGTLHYSLYSPDGCEKRLLMRLKPLKAAAVSVNGRSVNAKIDQECGFSTLTAILGTDDRYEIAVTPAYAEFEVKYQKCKAQGGELAITCNNAVLTGIGDREGLFESAVVSDGVVKARLKRELLEPYRGFGKFGIINYARRMFIAYINCGGVQYAVPCPLTVLPEHVLSASVIKGEIKLRVENNADMPLNGELLLRIGKSALLSDVSVAASSSSDVVFTPDARTLSYLTLGANRAVMCGALNGELNVISQSGRFPSRLPLPEELLKPCDYWKKLGLHPHHGCEVQNAGAYLNGFDRRVLFYGAEFVTESGFVPVSTRFHRFVSIPLNRRARKLYVIVSAFVDNHEMNSRLFDVEIEREKGDSHTPPLYKYTLYYPGTLDCGYGGDVIAGFQTFDSTVDRTLSPTQPAAGAEDYPNVMPPEYPQRYLFCDNPACEKAGAVFNLLEFDLGEERSVKTLCLLGLASDAACGVFGIYTI